MTRAGVKLSLDVGELVSNAGRAEGAISSLTQKMKQAQDKGDWDGFVKYQFERDRLQGQNKKYTTNLQRMADNPRMSAIGANGQQVLKMDSNYLNTIKDQTAALKKLYEKFDNFTKAGDTQSADAMLPQINEAQSALNKEMEEAGGGVTRNGAADAVKSIALNQITGAINAGMKLWVSSIDRTASINAYGNGDVLGGSLAERQRKANAWSGGLEAGGAAATGIGMALAPLTKLSKICKYAPNK